MPQTALFKTHLLLTQRDTNRNRRGAKCHGGVPGQRLIFWHHLWTIFQFWVEKLGKAHVWCGWFFLPQRDSHEIRTVHDWNIWWRQFVLVSQWQPTRQILETNNDRSCARGRSIFFPIDKGPERKWCRTIEDLLLTVGKCVWQALHWAVSKKSQQWAKTSSCKQSKLPPFSFDIKQGRKKVYTTTVETLLFLFRVWGLYSVYSFRTYGVYLMNTLFLQDWGFYEFLLCQLSRKLLWTFSSNLPGNFALKNGRIFWWIFSGLRFPQNEARKLLKKFGENSEKNSGQNSGRTFEKIRGTFVLQPFWPNEFTFNRTDRISLR